MKIQLLVTLGAFVLCTVQSFAQDVWKNEPLILAEKENVDIAIGKQWHLASWRISPQIQHDTLKIRALASSEEVKFRTDKDSIQFTVNVGETKSFYIKLENALPAHTIISVSPFPWEQVSYNKTDKRKDLQFFFEKANNRYFDSLRNAYPIAEVIKNDRSDMEKVLSVLNWAHHQWKHDGNNTPKRITGLGILDEAKAGARFPCFAYAIVLKDQLTANGYKARVVYLKTKDAETRQSSPGHVATEVYLNDLKKWVFIDGQFNVMPTLDGTPLNAVEFQQALSNHYDQVVLKSRDEVSKSDYINFVYDYLYYYDTSLDNRLVEKDKKFVVDGKTSIMLVPSGAPNLTKTGFWKSTIDYCVYTSALNDFYAVPK